MIGDLSNFGFITVEAYDEWNVKLVCKCGWEWEYREDPTITRVVEFCRSHLKKCTYEGA